MDKKIINLCPTGMIPTKEMTPHVPISCNEIVEDVKAVKPTIVHLHARGIDGTPTWEPGYYYPIIEHLEMDSSYNPIICVSTSGRHWPEYARRSQVLDLKPEMASLTLSSLNFNKQASVNEPKVIMKLAERMLDLGIKPELEIFDLGMVNMLHYLIRKDLLEPPCYANIILGNIACAQAKMSHLGTIVAELPDDTIWCVGGIGSYQLKANIMGLLEGHGVRVGLEDNIFYDAGRYEKATNDRLASRIRGLMRLSGMKQVTPNDLRKKLWREVEDKKWNPKRVDLGPQEYRQEDEWEKWVEEMPAMGPNPWKGVGWEEIRTKMKAWLKRMPKGGRP